MSIQEPRILCLFSAPLVGPDGGALAALDVEKERETIVRELSACNRKMTLRVAFATVDELARGIADGFNILHLSGHGHEDYLLFEDGKGGSHPVAGAFLKKLIGAGGPFELAIVGACHSEKIGEMIVGAGVRHVVAIRCDFPVLDSAAIAFIGEFFRNLFRRAPIQKAFEMGKLLVEGNPLLAEIKPLLEDMADAEGEGFVAEEEKFVLLPTVDPSFHLVELVAQETEKGGVTVEGARLSKTNLPTRPQSFTGRSLEMYALINEVLAKRLVTITGAGGIGKTALAREVARWFHSRGHFPDGVFSIDLRQAESVEEIIAMLGASLEAKVSEIKDVVEWLRDRQCLLLLDNAEDALWREEEGVQELINAILEYAPKVKLLVTGQREVGGNLHEPELVYRLRSIRAKYARRLFRATAKRGMTKEEWESEVFDSLLGKLGGHPLSIVVMARQLGPGTRIEDLADKINKEKARAIEVKSITDRDREHGKSLVASLSAAYENLSEEGKKAFGVLSLLPAGAQDFTMREVLGEKGWEYALELYDASLVEITVYERVVLIPPVRLFAESVVGEEVRDEFGPKILGVMAGYAKQFYEHMGAVDAKKYRVYFAMEEPNMRFAVGLPCPESESNEEASMLGFVAPYLLELYRLTYRHRDGRQVGDGVTDRLEELKDKRGLADTLWALGNLAVWTDDLKDAKDKYAKALELYEQVDNKLGRANTLHALGHLAVRTRDLKDAKDKYPKALEIFEQMDEKIGQANTLQALGRLAAQTDDLKDAKENCHKALEIFKQIDSKLGQAGTLYSLGELGVRTGDLKDAKEKCAKALEIYQEIDENVGQANTLWALGDLAVRTGDLKDAKDKYDKALEIYEQVDEKLGRANTLRSLGQWFALKGDLARADSRLEEARGIYEEIEEGVGQSEVHATRALVLIKRGDDPGAREEMKRVSSMREKVMGYGEAAGCLIFYAEHLRGEGFDEGAKICLEYAGEFASKARDSDLQEKVKELLKEGDV